MSAIDDMDQTFVNGIAVGGANAPADPRNYPLPVGVLKPGANEIMVFVRNAWGPGGFTGPAGQFALRFADGHAKPLNAGWQYARIADSVGQPPNAPWEGSSGVSTIYNAMVAPLGPAGLKGVAWYQGEADVGQPGYDQRLAAWIDNWRTQFRDPALPFLIVGLAGWGKPVSKPNESGWAALIDEQRLAVSRDRRTALASAIDLGEPEDIHPPNKQEVGRRLALAAKALAYGGGTVGPMPVSAARWGNASSSPSPSRCRCSVARTPMRSNCAAWLPGPAAMRLRRSGATISRSRATANRWPGCATPGRTIRSSTSTTATCYRCRCSSLSVQ